MRKKVVGIFFMRAVVKYIQIVLDYNIRGFKSWSKLITRDRMKLGAGKMRSHVFLLVAEYTENVMHFC